MRYGWRRDEFDTFKYSMLEERLEQVREIDGELAYEKMRRAVGRRAKETPSLCHPHKPNRAYRVIHASLALVSCGDRLGCMGE